MGRVEVKLLALGELLEAGLGELVLLDVGIVEVNARLQDNDEFIWRVVVVVPEARVVDRGGLLAGLGGSAEGANSGEAEAQATEVDDVELAVVDHLVGDLHEQAGHSLVSVIVASNGVDHLDGVHEGGKGLLNGFGVAFVEGLDELLKGLQVLHVVLGLVECLSHAQLNSTPLGGGKEDLVAGLSNISVGLGIGGSKENIKHSGAVLGAELLGDAGELAHALFPVLELLAGAGLFVLFLLLFSLVEGLFDLLAPLGEDSGEVRDHSRVQVLDRVDVLGVLLPLGGVGLENNVALEGAEGLLHFLSELVESVEELALLVVLADAPIGRLELVDKRLVDIVDHSVKSDHGVLTDLTKKNFVVVLALGVNRFAGRSASHEVNTLAAELFFLAYKKNKSS